MSLTDEIAALGFEFEAAWCLGDGHLSVKELQSIRGRIHNLAERVMWMEAVSPPPLVRLPVMTPGTATPAANIP